MNDPASVRRIVVLFLLLLARPGAPEAAAQQDPQAGRPGDNVFFLQHADSLEGKIIDGERARELIGNVLITHERTRITCDRALQFVDRGKVILTGNVVVRDDSMTLHAPRGTYDKFARRVEAFDDVRLDDGTMRLNSTYGEYLPDPRRAFFAGRVVVVDSASMIAADTLWYYRTTRRTLATGHVRLYNEGDRVTVYGGRLDHDAPRAYSRVTIDPVLVQIDTASGEKMDTLQVRALLLEAYRDTTRRFIATDSVEIVRTELAGRAGYACFYMRGDSITLRRHPVIWYEESQVTGDSINVRMKKRKLRQLVVMANAFALSQSDSLRKERIDQLNGDRLTMLFGDGGLQRTDVEGRAISVYHLYDDSLANGLNKTSGDRIVMEFADGRARTITVHSGVEGNYYPENMVLRREKEYAIPGITWRLDRPRRRELAPFVPPVVR
jgi:lipopolysaccharide export system protein LptA